MARWSVTQTPLSRALVGGFIALTMLVAPASAFAWGNGSARSGNGFGTHDWVLTEANRMAATQGATWVNASIALPVTDDPDTRIRDTKDHVYDRWGKANGNAQKKVAYYYAQSVASLAAGDVDSASRSLGLLSHYYADVNNPLNTDNAKAESRMHSKYDSAIDSRLNAVAKNRSWVSYDGYDHVRDASASTVSAARSSHTYYKSLVGQYNKRGYNNKTVRAISYRSINRATNGLADIIVSIQEDAALVGSSKHVGAHQGVATDGSANSDYWIIHTSWIQRYDSNWYSIATTTTPFRNVDGTYLTGFTASDSEAGSRTISPKAHLGSGTYYRSADSTHGHLYVPAENWGSTSDFDNQHILVFNAETLQRERSVATSETHEVAAAVVASGTPTVDDPEPEDVLYVASFNDSGHLFQYDLRGFDPHNVNPDAPKHIGDLRLSPVPAVGIQGLTYRRDKDLFFIGTGRDPDVGRIYTAERTTGATRFVYISTLPGWHEGIAWRNNLLLWLVDHGSPDSRVRYIRLPGF
jgi:hypothetical protein